MEGTEKRRAAVAPKLPAISGQVQKKIYFSRISFLIQFPICSLEAERLEHQQALDTIVKENDQEMERLTADIKSLKNELEKVKDKLQRGIEENEVLCAKLRDVKASPASTPSMHRRFSKRSLSRVDSLSDLASSTSLEDADQIATWDRDRYADQLIKIFKNN